MSDKICPWADCYLALSFVHLTSACWHSMLRLISMHYFNKVQAHMLRFPPSFSDSQQLQYINATFNMGVANWLYPWSMTSTLFFSIYMYTYWKLEFLSMWNQEVVLCVKWTIWNLVILSRVVNWLPAPRVYYVHPKSFCAFMFDFFVDGKF